jgi:hypothetical protein
MDLVLWKYWLVQHGTFGWNAMSLFFRGNLHPLGAGKFVFKVTFCYISIE